MLAKELFSCRNGVGLAFIWILPAARLDGRLGDLQPNAPIVSLVFVSVRHGGGQRSK
jgi:hypothetical protein